MAFSSIYQTRHTIADEDRFVRSRGAVRFDQYISSRSYNLRRASERALLFFLLRLQEERAHNFTLKLANVAQHVLPHEIEDDIRLAQRAFGLNFSNPIGIAAGVDKDAQAFSAFRRFGFGFVEVGTVTPNRQLGNPGPRVFRLRDDEAVINRFGFNSEGKEAMLRSLAVQSSGSGIVGVNIGANKDSTDRVADYVSLIECLAPLANYFAVNISSPNTPGLRDLQQPTALSDLLGRVIEAKECASQRAGPVPVLLKIAPDLSLGELDEVVRIARARRVDGMIVSNTTISRSGLTDHNRNQNGGLSGRPLFALSTRMLAETYVRVEGAFPLIGAGGINSGSTALAKIRAGASLIQLYTGLIFHGVGLLDDIKVAILNAMETKAIDKLSDLIGLDAAEMTAQPLPA